MISGFLTFVKNRIPILMLLICWVWMPTLNPILGNITFYLTVVLILLRGNFEYLLYGILFTFILAQKYAFFSYYYSEWYKLRFVIIVLSFIILIRKFFQAGEAIKIFFWFLPFFTISLICAFYSPIPSTAFQKLLSYIMVTLVASFIGFVLGSHEKTNYFQIVAFFLFFLHIFINIFGFLYPTLTHYAGRFSGLFGNPNELGIFCFISICYFIIFRNKINFQPKLQFIFLFLIFLGLWKSGSRSALFTSIELFLFSYFFHKRIMYGIIAFVIAIPVNLFVFENLKDILEALGLSTFFRVETLEAQSGRIIARQFLWQHIKDHILIGKGFDYEEFLFKHTPLPLELVISGHQGWSAHNFYLSLIANTGILGLLAYLIPFVFLHLRLSKVFPNILAYLATLLIYSNFEKFLMASLVPSTFFIYFMLGLGYGAINLKTLKKQTVS